MKEIKIKAPTYAEFAKKALALSQKEPGFLSLAFHKANGSEAVFRDQENNRIIYLWEPSGEEDL